MGGGQKSSQQEDPFAQFKGLLDTRPTEVKPYEHGNIRNVYDAREMQNLLDALQRLSGPAPQPKYQLPPTKELYGTEGITF